MVLIWSESVIGIRVGGWDGDGGRKVKYGLWGGWIDLV